MAVTAASSTRWLKEAIFHSRQPRGRLFLTPRYCSHGAWREGTVGKVCVRPKVPWLGVQIVGVSAHSGKMLHDFAEFSEEPGIFIL